MSYENVEKNKMMNNEKVTTWIYSPTQMFSHPILKKKTHICINVNVFTLKHDTSFLSYNYWNLMERSVDELETVNAVIRSWNCSLLTITITIIIMAHPIIASYPSH